MGPGGGCRFRWTARLARVGEHSSFPRMRKPRPRCLMGRHRRAACTAEPPTLPTHHGARPSAPVPPPPPPPFLIVMLRTMWRTGSTPAAAHLSSGGLGGGDGGGLGGHGGLGGAGGGEGGLIASASPAASTAPGSRASWMATRASVNTPFPRPPALDLRWAQAARENTGVAMWVGPWGSRRTILQRMAGRPQHGRSVSWLSGRCAPTLGPHQPASPPQHLCNLPSPAWPPPWHPRPAAGRHPRGTHGPSAVG